MIDMDISNFFDEIDHELMLKAVRHVIPDKWVAMYVRRWLEMPIQTKDGQILSRDGKGTPQGGVISPLLANLYLHFAIDKWLNLHYPQTSFVRYADDIIIHCNSKATAGRVLEAVTQRMTEVKLRVNKGKRALCTAKTTEGKNLIRKFSSNFLGSASTPDHVKVNGMEKPSWHLQQRLAMPTRRESGTRSRA